MKKFVAFYLISVCLLTMSCSKSEIIDEQLTPIFSTSLEFRSLSNRIEAYAPKIVENVYPARGDVNCQFVFIDNYLLDIDLFEICMRSEDVITCVREVPKIKVNVERIINCK